MTETRTLVRDVLKYGPDGNSVRKTQTLVVTIAHDGKLNDGPQGYDNVGEWRLLPKSEPTP